MKLMKLQANNQGFTVLFAVLAASALLIMALGITNISYRETVLSGSARVADRAFYAADSGAECALYWDWQGAFPVSGSSAMTIECLSSTHNLIGTTSPYSFDVTSSTPPRCVRITVDKNYLSSGNTRIESRGYNVECGNIPGNPRAVERLIEVLF